MGDMADQYGMAVTSIGYVPITARRGGIKYPRKETPVAKTLPQQLADLKAQHAKMGLTITMLEAKAKRAARPSAPPADQSRWSIVVQFTEGGKRYEYLVFRNKTQFYTTGDGSTATFWTWEAFLDWLDQNAHWHSTMYQLELDYESPVALKGSDD